MVAKVVAKLVILPLMPTACPMPPVFTRKKNRLNVRAVFFIRMICD